MTRFNYDSYWGGYCQTSNSGIHIYDGQHSNGKVNSVYISWEQVPALITVLEKAKKHKAKSQQEES